MADKNEKQETTTGKHEFPTKEAALIVYANALREFGPHNRKEGKVFKAIVKQFPTLKDHLYTLRIIKTHLLIEEHKKNKDKKKKQMKG